MNLNIKFSWTFVIWAIIFCLTIIWIINTAARVLEQTHEYDKYILQNTQSNIIWEYNCDSGWQSNWYNCGSQLRNLTGYYCNGTMICQNKYRVKD